MKHEPVRATPPKSPSSSPLPWAKPVLNGMFRDEGGTHSWVTVHWLSPSRALVGYLTRDKSVAWERLNIRTGQRHRETAFGAPLHWHRYERRDGSFHVAAVSPNGRHLLGYRECERFDDSTYAVVSQGGKEQRWSVSHVLDGNMTWLPDSTGWFSPWKSINDGQNNLWLFRLGERRPQRCRLRGLPKPSPESEGQLPWGVLGMTPWGEALLISGQITHAVPEVKSLVADLYVVRVEDGAHARRLPPLRLSPPRLPSLHRGMPEKDDIGYFNNYRLSPDGRRLLLEAELGSEERGRTTVLYVCGLDGRNLREIGRIPLHKPTTSGQWDGIALGGACWHHDSRHVSFFYGDFDGYRLYLAPVPA